MAKVRWGVIGCGGIAARGTIPEFKQMVSNAEITSVMDIDYAAFEANCPVSEQTHQEN
ncbi:hypothetical protein LCGC14_1720930 [marine sediment metagenome]|uniref:Gfo/Idh/MocA-like oxidoreductase N-terminal domain-containing protein n=1 Tax=marine sediment metagenome TaxID=412755 RepID=A0A0F9HC75_9ZZZZ